mmetsp:Transcript_17874/g.31715  ORF Transcript_17874/g.31715 Transcript_17874/m.31715 type:complete len:93 (-) Transcript_17874:242-520(-)
MTLGQQGTHLSSWVTSQGATHNPPSWSPPAGGMSLVGHWTVSGTILFPDLFTLPPCIVTCTFTLLLLVGGATVDIAVGKRSLMALSSSFCSI